jgi:hypothetical protein
MSLEEFRQLIEKHLDIEELRTLCFDLNVDYDSLPGEGKAAKIRELIAFMRRNDRIPELVNALTRLRPLVPWKDLEINGGSVAPIPTVPNRRRLWFVIGAIILFVAVIARLLLPPTPSPTSTSTSVPPSATSVALTETSVFPTPTPTALPPTLTPTHVPSSPTPPPPTKTPEPPHAPMIKNNFGTPLYDEQLILLTIASGEKKILKVQDLWSAPLGTPVSCASGFIAFTWLVRDPYPEGGEDLEFHRIVPMGGGRTEVFAHGATGASSIGYCDELTIFNTSLVDYRVEIRYASGSNE